VKPKKHHSSVLLIILLLCSIGRTDAVEVNAPLTKMDPLFIAGDTIDVTVFNHVDMSAEVCVDSHGTIVLPYIGSINGLFALNTSSLSARIAGLIEDGYLLHPIVQVVIRIMANRQVIVMGNVNHPCAIPLDPRMHNTVLQAVMMAGGFSDTANQNRIFLLRDDPSNIDGDKMIINLANSGTIADGQAPRDLPLQIDDVIIVPRQDSVCVLGQVLHPGTTTLPEGTINTVSSAIAIAGGFGPYARTSKIRLIRQGVQATVNIKAVLSGKAGAQDPKILPGDTIYVPESQF
jgi:polysaccharide export outer membrane protein